MIWAKARLDSYYLFLYCSRYMREENMIGYITLGTSDLARGAKFYDALAEGRA